MMHRKPCPECVPVTGEPVPAPVLKQSDFEQLLHDLQQRTDLSDSDREKIQGHIDDLWNNHKTDSQ